MHEDPISNQTKNIGDGDTRTILVELYSNMATATRYEYKAFTTQSESSETSGPGYARICVLRPERVNSKIKVLAEIRETNEEEKDHKAGGNSPFETDGQIGNFHNDRDLEKLYYRAAILNLQPTEPF
ncbi:hypothetical protein TNCV_2644981 [Trichonephila clavipes]|nr:hypothetical protein TNCV_2644981 [Trichonephila clavipes]